MIPRVLYLVSSHVSYAEPLKTCLSSLGVLPFAVVVGGAEVNRERPFRYHWEHASAKPVEMTAIVREVTHNSFDYTALIELLEERAPRVPDHICLLHDTMEVGPNTDRLVRSANIHSCATAAWGGQCNLVLFRYDYLLAQRDFILSLKNCTKAQAVAAEGQLWRMAPEDRRHSFPDTSCEVRKVDKRFGGADRLCEYYGGVDIIKWKANYGQSSQWVERP